VAATFLHFIDLTSALTARLLLMLERRRDGAL